MRVASVIASSWSCVTTMKVTPSCLLDFHQLELGFLAQLLVERAERFVEQQQLGPLGEGAGEGDALALAAGQLVRLALAVILELHQGFKQFGDARLDLGLRQVVALQPVGDVLLTPTCAGTARRTGTSC
jgi:hypothetical protein